MTPQMSAVVSADPSGLSRVTSFGDAVIQREQPIGGPPLPKFDLTSPSGRVQAVSYYKDLFRKFSTGDAYIAGYNVRFDVRKAIDSARQIPEFMEDPEAVRLLGSFETRMFQEGGIIDTLQLVRTSLKGQISDRLDAARVAGDDYGQRAALALESIFSPSAMSRATDVGERVSAFGLENILESTDFLSQVAKRAQAGDALSEQTLRQLASGAVSHTDYVDRQVTQILTEIALSPSGIGLIPEDKTSHLTGVSPEYLNLIELAQRNVAASKAMTATVSIADPRYLTQKTLDYLTETPTALRRVQIEDQLSAIIGSSTSPVLPSGITPSTRGTLRYSSSGSGGFVFAPTVGGTEVPISETIATNYIRNEIDKTRAIPTTTIMPSPRTSNIKTLGISPIQQTNIEYMGRYLATGTPSTINTGNVLDAARSISSNEEIFFRGMTATGNITGFTSGLSPEKRSGAYGVVRHPMQALSQARMENYQKALYESGVVAASMQPEVRSAAVSLSATTAPIGAKNTQLISGALSQEIDPAGAIITRTAEDITSRVTASSDLIARNLPLLSEIGAVYGQAQKTLSIGESISAIPFDILREMKTIDDSGAEVMLIDRLKGETANRSARVRLSRATRTESTTPTINFIYGEALGGEPSAIQIARAKKEAEELIRVTKSRIEGRTPQEMISAGFATSEEHFQRIQAAITDPQAAEKIARSRLQRGFVISSIDPSVDPSVRPIAEQVSNILDTIAGGIDSDVISEQKQLLFDSPLMSDQGAVFTLRQSDEVVSELQRSGTALGTDLLERSSSSRQLTLLQGAIRAGVDTSAEDGGGVFGRARAHARSIRPDDEIAGSSTAILRGFRDMNIEERMRFLKPKIYKGAIGLAALSAGYYLAKRSRKNELYDDTMEQQEFEQGPMSIQDFNSIDQQFAMQTSSRRDPLVTAGVVGNLDRNKTSHYRMGPGKYNHLYGG